MRTLTDFIRSRYTRMRSYFTRDTPGEAARQDPPADTQNSDVAQFEQAQALYQRGLWNDAEAIYRTLQQKYPQDFDLLHALGMIQGQRGNFAAARALIEQALAIDPNSAAAHCSHGNCLKGLGKHEEALASYDRALALQPNDADILSNRGATLRDLKRPEAALSSYDRALAINNNHVMAHDNRGTTLRDMNRLQEALASHERALAISPDCAPAHFNRGAVLQSLRRYEEARASYERALALNLVSSDLFNSLGVTLGSLGRQDEALLSYERALTLEPRNAELLVNRGIALRNLRRFEEALGACDQVLALDPDNPGAHNNRGTVLHELKRYDEALASFDQALALRSDYTEAHINRGAALRELNRHEDALAAFSRALNAEPGNAIAHYNRGITVGDLKQYEESLASYERALAQQPQLVEAHNNRGSVLRELRRYDEALASYSKGLAINPDHLSTLHNRGDLLVYLSRTEQAAGDFARLVMLAPDYDYAQGYLLKARMSCCDWRDLNALSTSIFEGVRQGKPLAEPFCCLAISADPELLKRCAGNYAAEKFPPLPLQRASPRTHNDNRIRLGYVAGEFRHHATSILTAGLFERHDSSRFELFAFDNGWDDGSEIRKRLEKVFTRIVDISRLSDSQAAAEICNLDIDILVDLNGHVGLKRTGVFSLRPAPVQVNWLGFPGTMGVDYMDYIIGDAQVIPTGHEVYYSEKVVRLPDTYQVNDSKRTVSERTPTRSEAKLPDSAFVFCCFNNTYKITPEVFDIWMRLLRRVDHSVLWLLEDNPAASRNLRSEAAARGMAPERLVFAPRMALPDHLARHRLADLFLDTVPCNAHTTASDALWAGLPVLTCMGETFASRVAGSLLHAVGLSDLTTDNLADYEALAYQLATAPAMLVDLRTRLANNRNTHPLFDTDRFRRHIESAYACMHERRMCGKPPEAFVINPLA